MLKVGLVGLGFMGNSHLQNYLRLEEEGFPIKLVAICDVDEAKQGGALVEGNLPTGVSPVDFSQYTFYQDMAEMIEKEDLDYVDLCLPTYLHSPKAVEAMSLGMPVFCEKPMAISSEAAQEMIDASEKYGKQLMIGQTLRFFPSYLYVKETIDSGRYGKVVAGSFFRGGTTPIWSWENWLLKKDKSGGCLLDQHIHDVDTINWLFGPPESVSTSGKVINEGNGYDIVSSNYHYADGKVVNAEDDWTINNDDFGFEMRFRVNFERGTIILENGKLRDYPHGDKSFEPDISKESGYYLEIKHFAESILNNTQADLRVPSASAKQTIYIAEKEQASADANGKRVSL
ncbi:Gfo/Idh/MocA family oxidoreductase [Vagococcus sp. BWB3-3]|uniref:Gfo/Idh/MocA family oxidoreductase n=1 Tax=Vagococcus allomyrinae TaxID=2794353 RepID=A0A940SWH6_9ENTE|nr:Gfo/Idh/MocA family oxidoreductase [Vagococcus allomyrinae]MBP1043004.1 Gfo/Idh/MocA family oxidoreductase [Vagococcus allomyrinae]